MTVTRDFAPRLLTSAQAAHFLGVSETTLRTLAIPRRILHGKRLFDRAALDAFADSLPLEGSEGGHSICDQIFGDSA